MMRCISILFFLFGIYIPSTAQRSDALKPDFIVLQHAGSIGFISTGIGYSVFKEKGRASLHYGFVPKPLGGPLNILSAKVFFEPLSLPVWHRVTMNPIDFGIMGSYHYGSGYESRWPSDQYPEGYYWWNPAIRVHVGMESSVTIRFKKDHPLRSASAYIEFNTNELYLVSYLQNTRTIRFMDIVKIGTGARLYFNR